MSSKMVAAEHARSFDTADGYAATNSTVTNESMDCDPGSGAKDPGAVSEFVSLNGALAPSFIASNAVDDTTKPGPKAVCDGIVIAHKAETSAGELKSSPASSSSTAEAKEVVPKLDVSFGALSLAGASPSTKKGDSRSVLPEIWTTIIKFAMTSDTHGRLLFDCGTGVEFKPNVAVSLLRVNHATYHEAIAFLYSENIFFFHHFGTDLKIIDKPVGLSSCLVAGCPSAMSEPRLKKMEFRLGSYCDPALGSIATRTFQHTLEVLRHTIHVEELWLHMLPYTFLNEESVQDFAAALTRIEVSHTLIITGPAAQNDYDDVYIIADALGMDLTPVERSLLAAFGGNPYDEEESNLEEGLSYFRFQIAASVNVDGNEGRAVEDAMTTSASTEHAEAI